MEEEKGGKGGGRKRGEEGREKMRGGGRKGFSRKECHCVLVI